MANSVIWKYYKVTVVFGMFLSFHAWFTFSINTFIAEAFIFFLGFAAFIRTPKNFKADNLNKKWYLLLCFAVFFTTTHKNLNGVIGAYWSISTVLFIFLLSSAAKEHLLNFSINVLGSVFAVSTTAWIFHLIGKDLPYTLIKFGESDIRDAYIYENHYLYLVNITNDAADLVSLFFERFSCIFLEPGYTGCLLSILLYLGGYKFNKQNWYNIVFFISLIFTLSLAGWLITAFGFFMHKIEFSKNRLKIFIALLCFAIGFYVVVVNYNGGNNILNYAIIERLTGNDEGTIVWNRGSNIESYFYDTFIHSDEKWFGTSKQNLLGPNDVDWKSYIVAFGLVGFISYLLFLYFPILKCKQHKFELFTLASIYALIFVQTIASAFWMMYIVYIVLGVNRIRFYSRINKNEVNRR